MKAKTDKQTDRLADAVQTDRQATVKAKTDKQTDRQADAVQTDRQATCNVYICVYV